MNTDNIARIAGRIIQYIRDPMPVNHLDDAIWCLGRRYDSRPSTASSAPPTPAVPAPASSTAPTASPADSIASSQQEDGFEKIQPQDAVADNGWPPAFLDDLESRIWLTYRSNFSQIAKSTDPTASASMSFLTRARQMANHGGFTAEGFTTDTGWGCMIRSGQSLLANTLQILELGRDWRNGQEPEAERKLLSLFADDPSAPFSIHRFVDHGAQACGKHPGEWFGPSAAARCIQALVNDHSPSGLRVYVRPDDADVYQDSFMRIARREDGSFHPTLILLGTRLGIDRVTPVYREAIKTALCLPQSVGIAGGQPSSSHYFVGTQADHFFYLDPHTTRPLLPSSPTETDIASCHTRRLRLLQVTQMDPSMLLGFLIRDEADWKAWKAAIQSSSSQGSKPIIHIHDTEPSLGGDIGAAGYSERPSAVDEVQSCDEDDDEDAVVC